MNEEFLQYVWRFQQFSSRSLFTSEGDQVEVIHPGEHNQNAGPDFLNARIRIGETLWAGNVEVHINASDWYKHKHQFDSAYQNVILHVVYTPDKNVLDKRDIPIPVLRLDDKIDFQSYRFYKAWLKEPCFIPCERSVKSIPNTIKALAVEAAAIKRMHSKSEDLLDQLRLSKGDQEQVFYTSLCRSIGLKVNAIPFEQFSYCTPFKLIRKYRQDSRMLEALFFGQAGFLGSTSISDPYVDQLKETYKIIRLKHNLTPLPVSTWKLSRLRPASFPTIRLAQLAQIYLKNPSLAQLVLEVEDLVELQLTFQAKLNNPFWLNHYAFRATSKSSSSKSLGQSTIRSIIINTVVPYLFAMASFNKDGIFKEKALALLEALEPEKNRIVNSFQDLGFTIQNALDTQGLLELKKSYCDKKQCLNCKIGVFILKESCSE